MSVDASTLVDQEFRKVLADFGASRVMTMLAQGKVTAAHYRAALREIYHYAKEDPQIQALAAVY